MDDEQRFMAKVLLDEGFGCWLWTAYCQPNGYARFTLGSRVDGSRQSPLAHRWAYEHWIGPIPKGLTIDHLCRVVNCVNPNHLEAVPIRVNLLRGNTVTAKNAAATHCPSGHAYKGDNLRVRPNGDRVCRTCHRDRNRKRYQERAAADPAWHEGQKAAMRARRAVKGQPMTLGGSPTPVR